MSDIIKFGPEHLQPDLWQMADSNTGGEYQAFKCHKDTNVVYEWRVSEGEHIVTVRVSTSST